MINNGIYGSDHCPVEVFVDLSQEEEVEDDEKVNENYDNNDEAT